MLRWCSLMVVLLAASCSVAAPISDQTAFQRWLLQETSRADTFARFEALLAQEGVADVVPPYELWLTDQITRECVAAPFVAPPEEVWPNIVPALRVIRDQVEPAVGNVRVVSAYRDDAFNACIRGAPRSAHRSYFAVDLVPVDRTISREHLIQVLCPVHEREGARLAMGLGIYTGQRFHIDAHGFRGWGPDYHRATFPCDQQTDQ